MCGYQFDANSSAGCILLTDILLKVSDWNFPKLEEFLSIIPPKDSPWSSTPYIRVVRKFMKLAQYVSAGRHLQRMVQRFPTWKIQEVVKGPFTESSAGAEPDGSSGAAHKSGEYAFLPERTCAICYQDQNAGATTETEVMAAAASSGVIGSAQIICRRPEASDPKSLAAGTPLAPEHL